MCAQRWNRCMKRLDMVLVLYGSPTTVVATPAVVYALWAEHRQDHVVIIITL